MRSLLGIAFSDSQRGDQQDCEQQAHEQLILADFRAGVAGRRSARFSYCISLKSARKYVAMLLPRRRYLLLYSCLVVICWQTDLAAQSGSTKSVPKNSAATIAEMKQKAQGGDAEAQANLGLAYHQETASRRTIGRRRLVSQGSGARQCNRSKRTRTPIPDRSRGPAGPGTGLPVVQKMAKQKYPPAVMNVAVSYYNGDGVPEDMVAAYAWMLLADELGEKGAREAVERTRDELGKRAGEGEARLAELLEAGEELPKDEVAAAKWHSKAVEDGVTPTRAVPALAFAQRKPRTGNEHLLPNTFDRAGGEVVPPKLLSGPEPTYDPKSRNRQSSGTVVVQFKIATDGSTKDFHVVQSLNPELDQQAIKALERWKFSPQCKAASRSK